MSTRRHTLHGKCLIWVVSLVVSRSAFGQWDTNSWPAYLHSRGGYLQCSNVFAAVNERCDAVNISRPTAPSWYRSQRSNLQTFKTKTKAIITSYHNNSRYSGPFMEYLNSMSNAPSWSDDYDHSLSSLCAVAKIPTNFFDYTPYRGLDGVGPFTNDPTVGHPHGWTNEYTVAGGPDFPSGRTNWYTTDYGFDAMRRAITNLQKTSEGYLAYNYRAYSSTGTAQNADLDTAKAEAKAAFGYFGIGGALEGNYSTLRKTSGDFYADYLAALDPSGHLSDCKTSVIPSEVYAYFVTRDPPPSLTNYATAVYPCRYDGGLEGYTNSGVWYAATYSNAQSLYGWQLSTYRSNSITLGRWRTWADSGSTNIPPDGPEPAEGESIYTGYMLSFTYRVLLDFYGATNGFIYR